MDLPQDEKLLIQNLVQGNSASWSEFVAQYQKLVVHGVRRTARQCNYELKEAEVEDFSAEVFASLIDNDFGSLRRFRGQCRLSTWLMVIARRVCLNQLSRLRRASDSLQKMEQRDSPSNGCDLLNRMIHAEQSEEIKTSVKQLNDKDRLLVELYFVKQLSYAEIGKQAGISSNSVGPKLGRAIVRLRKLMRHV